MGLFFLQIIQKKIVFKVDYLAHHYERKEQKCQYEMFEKMLMVVPNMKKYQLTLDSLATFEKFHDYIELNNLKRYHVHFNGIF